MQALKAVVIILGVLIVLGTTVVIVTIYNRVSNRGDEAPPRTAQPTQAMQSAQPDRPELASFGTTEVTIPDGCRVMEMVPEGERLLLRLGSIARCNRILVVDLRSGALLGSIDLASPQTESQP